MRIGDGYFVDYLFSVHSKCLSDKTCEVIVHINKQVTRASCLATRLTRLETKCP